AYAKGGAVAVDALPGGRTWRAALEALAPEGERHLLTFDSHVTHLAQRDRLLLKHINTKTMVGDAVRIGSRVARIADAGFREVIYTPTGPDIVRELRSFASAYEKAKSPGA
ncbi:MAG: LLM class flavin-dependent oxidoreductase, partial [Mycobacterium sp.]